MPIVLTGLKEDLMPRVVALWLVASALLLYSNPGQAQIQRQPVQPQPQQAQPQQAQPQQAQPQQPQLQQQQQPQMQMQQLSLEQRRALQLPGTLVVERAGTASGKVESVDARPAVTANPMQQQSTTQVIDCGTRCDYTHRQHGPPQIHLKAVPDPGSLIEWSGACTGHQAECVIPMSADAKHRIVATFTKPKVTVRLQGKGTITGYNFNCSGRDTECSQEYPPAPGPDGSRLAPTITLNHSDGSPGHWSGCDFGSGGTSAQCRVTLTGAKVVMVTFPVLLNATRSGDGAGQVSTTPAPLGWCNVPSAPGAWCAHYWAGTDVTLTASGEFTRWTAGACSGQTTPTCRFRITFEADVSAQFTKPAPPPKNK
jgi:hypothetical protein